jgi:hypothetical protein
VDSLVVAQAPPHILIVKKYQTLVNEEDIEDVLATGSIPNILKFMRTRNILDVSSSFDLKYIYWLCKDSKFFKEGIEIMRAKNWYDHTFWSFSIMHKDMKTMKEYFNSERAGLKKVVGA